MKGFFILCLLTTVACVVYEIPGKVGHFCVRDIAHAMKCEFISNDNKLRKHAIAQREWMKLMDASQRRWDRERVMAKECRAKAKRYDDCRVWWAYFGNLFDPTILCAPPASQKCSELVEKHYPSDGGIPGAPGYQLHIFPENVYVIYCE